MESTALKYTELYQQLKQLEEKLNFIFISTQDQKLRLQQVDLLQRLSFLLVDPNDMYGQQPAMRFLPMDDFPEEKIMAVRCTLVRMEADAKDLRCFSIESYIEDLGI
jgi:hypothetical protein